MARQARPPRPATPARRIALRFKPMDDLEHVGATIADDVSALALQGRTLFATCDETSTVERLILGEDGFAEHRSYALGDCFDLPGGKDGEMDIEGLALDGGYLWICGSHSWKRDTPDAGDDPGDVFETLRDVSMDPNRHFLGRVPLKETKAGVLKPVLKTRNSLGETLRPAAIKMGKKKHRLRKWLAKDKLLKPFMDVPCKENGFDIEGLAARGDRVVLGLRGPVIGKQAVLIELDMKVTKKGHLKPRKRDGRRYRMRLLDLDGFGIRDLLLDGDDLYVLAGPVEDIDGMQNVYCWPDFLRDDIAHANAERMELRLELPMLRGGDHAEGIAAFGEGGTRRMIVAYDSPADERRDKEDLTADLFDWPGTVPADEPPP